MAIRKTNSKSSAKKSVESANAFPYLIFGTLFGYFLSKSGATDYDTIVDMFQCRSFQLYGVILTAIAVVAAGLFLLKWRKIPTITKKPLDWKSAELEPTRLVGAFLFGAGWALAGTCPGTALTQLGEGKVVAVFTVIGIGAGVWAYKKIRPEDTKNPVC